MGFVWSQCDQNDAKTSKIKEKSLKFFSNFKYLYALVVPTGFEPLFPEVMGLRPLYDGTGKNGWAHRIRRLVNFLIYEYILDKIE